MKLPIARSLRTLVCVAGLSALLTGMGRAQLVILPLGDSITYGFLSTSNTGSNGYRQQLYNDLGGSTSNVTFLGSQTDGNLPAPDNANEGHNGYTIEGIDAELEGNSNTEPGRSDSNNGGYWLTSGSPTGTPLNPQVVLLDIGTNNATDGDSAALMETRLQTLLNDLATDLPNAQIFVGDLTPRVDSTSLEAVEEQYNLAVPGIVATEGANFHFVDIHDAVSASNINVNDGVGGQHPDAAGYAQMGDAWYDALVADGIVQSVPEPSTYVLMGAGLLALFTFRRFRKVA